MRFMNIKTFIKPIGITAAAHLFGVPKSTLHSWLYRGSKPRIHTANRIVKITGGKVSLADIYGLDDK